MSTKLVLFYLLIQYHFNMIIVPFKTIIDNKNEEINQNNIQYNTTNFIEDYHSQPAYTNLQIGNPPQNIIVLLSYNDCGFKI